MLSESKCVTASVAPVHTLPLRIDFVTQNCVRVVDATQRLDMAPMKTLIIRCARRHYNIKTYFCLNIYVGKDVAKLEIVY